jgi:Na+-translocating ferredoxin:NAD+ oxidoreductase subunit D
MSVPGLLSSPHLRVQPDIRGVMVRVLIGLLPGIAVFTGLFGPGVLHNLLWCIVGAVLTEVTLLALRGRNWKAITDGSAVLTGALLAMALPPDTTWWLPLAGGFFAVALGKQVYGGIGYNPFNPAMVGYVVLLISFPVAMTAWPTPNLDWATDAVTQATALDHVRTELTQGRTLGEVYTDAGFAGSSVRGWLWVALAYLLGGLFLLQQRTISWQIPVGVIVGMSVMAMVFWGYDSDRYASPLFHLSSGAMMLGAFFIATDPVSASTTPRGRLLFGLGVGALTWIIRSWGGYPDGFAFAVLLMNILAPTLDRITPTRVYGTGKRGGIT